MRSCMEIHHPGALSRCQHSSRSFMSLLFFITKSYKVAQKEQSHLCKINTMLCLYAYKRFRKNQHQNSNKNSGYSECEWRTFLCFLNLLHQMFINTVTKKRKDLSLRGFSTSYCQFLPYPLFRGMGGRGHLREHLSPEN